MGTPPLPAVPADRLQNLPITLFGSVMGLCGLAIGYLRGAPLFGLPLALGQGLLWASAAWFALLTLLYLAKAVRHFAEVRAEFQHPVRMNFFPAWSISLLLFSIAWADPHPAPARALWYAGALLQLALLLRILSAWFHRDMHIHSISPAWFIPVVGTIIVPVSGVELVGAEPCWFFFSIGLIFWLALFTIVLYRIIFHDPLPERLAPTLFILIAPPAVGCIAALKLGGVTPELPRLLFYFALFTLLMLLSMIDRFRRVPFYVSWWAYTFPLDAIALAAMAVYDDTHLPFFRVLAGALLGLATLVVLLVLVRTIRAALRRELCVAEG